MRHDRKYEDSGDRKYVDRARRRGKLGWNVGARIEVMPHYRRPHPALVWTGPGRAVPRIVMRKGLSAVGLTHPGNDAGIATRCRKTSE